MELRKLLTGTGNMLSLVLLAYSASDHLKRLANEALDSYKNQADEVIVIEDGGAFDPNLMSKADIYAYHKENRGFTHSVNQGIKLSHGDYVAIVSNDTYRKAGHLQNLCIKDTVTSPLIENQPGMDFAGSFFVLPRSVIDKVGLLDESMKIYYSDEEYKNRLNKYKVPMTQVKEVVIHHHICQSVPSAKVDYSHDEENYENKLR